MSTFGPLALGYQEESDKRGVRVWRVTPRGCDLFWRCLRHWQVKLGLQDWRITSRTELMKRYIALTDKWDLVQRQCRVRLSTQWGAEEPSALEIERTAVHELLHVKLHPLSQLALDNGADQDAVITAEHGLINTIEAMLVPAPTEFRD
jgi:hypothetical protein